MRRRDGDQHHRLVRRRLTSNFLPSGEVGTDYARTFQVVGTPPFTATLVGGRLPLGLTLDPSTLTVSGIPTEAGHFFAAVRFADASGNPEYTRRISSNFFIGSGTSTLTINSPQPTGDLGTITAGGFYSTQFFACCTPAGTVWSVDSGNLPPGLALSSGGFLSGAPPADTAGTFTFVVRVQDASNSANFALRQFTIVFRSAPIVDTQPPSITISSPTFRSYTLNQLVTAVYSCSDPSGVQACTGNVANGASIDTSTLGTQVFAVTATDALGNSGTRQVSYVVVQPGALALANFYGIGDLPGGATASTVRDATVSAGVLYAVGAGAANNQVLCVAPNNPAGCVNAFVTDTAVLWSWDGTTANLTPLPDLATPGTVAANIILPNASAITRDAAFIASRARNNITNPGRTEAVRVTRLGLINLPLTEPPFPAFTLSGANAISDNGSILYGIAEGIARRWDVTTSSSIAIPLLPGFSNNGPADRGTSATVR
jgi:hypothetical protein